jgi:hypothetical protein
MFNSSVLDIAIGLVLVYLLISVVLTSVSEAIEGMLKSRAADLERALGELFQGDQTMLRDFYNHPLISALYLGGYRGTSAIDAASPAGQAAAAGQPAAPVAQAAVPDPTGGSHGNLPSYIPREAFSAAVMDLLNDPRGDRLKQAVDALAARHGVDPAATRRALESWYDGAMDRASGWFKRRTQVRLFILGLAIALIGNVNSVTIAQYLAENQEARDGLVQQAQQARDNMPPQPGAASPAQAGPSGNAAAADANVVADLPTGNEAQANMAQGPGGPQAADTARRDAWARAQYTRVQAIGLPIGWSDSVVTLMAHAFPTDRQAGSYVPRWILALVILLAGYLATAFAVMLGSPFWFDLLGKLMVVRSTVKPKQKSPDEPPVDGPAPVPAPPPAAGPPPRQGGQS